MPLLIFIFALVNFHAFSMNGILPPVFEASREEQKELCSEGESQNPRFWKSMMSDHIEEKIKKSELDGLNKDIYKNLVVTLSYLEIYGEGSSRTSAMGYVYANASHHLGRLVRYSYWKKFKDFPLGKQDIALISGDLLETSLRIIPGPLSHLLMEHSLDLYKNLSWSLGAERVCGRDYVLKMLENNYPLLSKAYTATSLTVFMKYFVEYEQTYLNETMYQVALIKIPAGLGVLDKMRFIPFNGEKSTSFYDWCKDANCKTTSLNLKNRVKFDQMVIEHELVNYTDAAKERLIRSQIVEVADFILKDLDLLVD